MKRHFLKPGDGLPFMGNKFVKAGRVFNGGGGTGVLTADDAAKMEAYTNKFREVLGNELKKRGMEDGETVHHIIEAALNGTKLDLDALRDAPTKINILNTELEKLKNRAGNSGQKMNLRSALRAWMEEKGDQIVANLRSRNTNWEESLNIRAAVNMTTTNIINNTAVPDDILDSFSLGAFEDNRFGRRYVSDIADVMDVAEVTKYKTWLEAGSIEGGFALVVEGTLKPKVSAATIRAVATAKKIAAKYVLTEETEKFKAEIFNIVEMMIRDELLRQRDDIVTADIQAVAVGYTGTPMDATITNPNNFHAIGAAILQAQLLQGRPNVLVINPADEWQFRFTTNANQTLWFPVITQDGVTTIFGLRVVSTTEQNAGTFTVAESGLFKVQQESISIRVGYGIDVTVTGGNVTQVVSDFDNNQKRIILESWILDWLPTNRVGYIVTASFATVKAALAA